MSERVRPSKIRANRDQAATMRAYVEGPPRIYDVRCLKCEEMFKGWSKTANRICPKCTEENGNLVQHGGRTATIGKTRKGC